MKRTILLLLLLALIVVQGFWYYQLIAGLLVSDAIKQMDFISFHTAGRVVSRWGPRRLYETGLQLQVQEMVLGLELDMGDLLAFNHPPIWVPFLKALISTDYITSYIRWFLFLLLFVGLNAYLLTRLTKPLKTPVVARFALLVSLLVFYPMFISLLKGQDTVLVLLGVSVWALFFHRGEDWLAGLGLALVTPRPHIALLLALPFLFARRRVWWGFMLGSLLLLVYSFFLVGRSDFLITSSCCKSLWWGKDSGLTRGA